MSLFKSTPAALASLLLLGASAVQAQRAPGNVADGTSNTVLLPERGGNNLRQVGDGSVRAVEPVGASLTTRATVSGNVTQSNLSLGPGNARQTVSIGGVDQPAQLAGNISTQGTLVGDISQSRRSNAAVAQSVSIGGVDGSLTVRGSATLTGTVQADITQRTDEFGPSTSGSQRVDVGASRESSGGNLEATGTLAGNLLQAQRGGAAQSAGIGSVEGSTLDSAVLQGTVSAAVSQSSNIPGGGSGSASQQLLVGAALGVQANAVRTDGLLAAALTQSQTQAMDQSVRIGSVVGVDAGGRLAASGQVLGAVSQQSTGRGVQSLSVGAIGGGSPQDAQALGIATGTITQASSAPGSTTQVISIGSIDLASGRAVTDAQVGATITQTLTAGANGASQNLAIGTVRGTTGSVQTRVVVNGAINQSANSANARQVMRLGSVQDTGANVRTDVTVSGTLSQSSNPSAQTQTLLVGAVSGSGPNDVDAD